MDQEIARLKELTEKSRAMVFFLSLIHIWLTAAPAAATF